MADEYAQTSTTTTRSTTDVLAPAITDNTSASTPDTRSPAYLRMEPRWRRCRTLMAETDGVRDAGEEIIPKLEGEEDDDYEARTQVCALTNAFKRTVKAMAGLVLQKRPVLGDDMPAVLKTLAENINASGSHLAAFVWQLVIDALVDGHAGILVDYQRLDAQSVDTSRASAAAEAALKNGGELDASDEPALGLRPYWVKFKAADIFLAMYKTVNGQRTLVLLVLREISEELSNPNGFGVQAVVRYRVYRRVGQTVTCEVWKSIQAQTPAIEHTAITLKNVTAIPFAWAVSGDVIAGDVMAPSETAPPLLNLADLNIEHHNVRTDKRHLERLACIPTIKRKGYVAPIVDGEPDPAPVLLGPKQVNDIPLEGDIEWFSPDVTVLEPITNSIADLKADMGAAGLAFLAPETRAAETAEAKRIDSAAQNASLATFASNLQDALELAFQFTAQFLKTTAGKVTVNTDFEGTVLDSSMVSALGTLAANGNLSIDTLLETLERGRVLPEGFNREQELAKIMKQNTLPPEPQPVPTDVATGDGITKGDLGAAA